MLLPQPSNNNRLEKASVATSAIMSGANYKRSNSLLAPSKLVKKGDSSTTAANFNYSNQKRKPKGKAPGQTYSSSSATSDEDIPPTMKSSMAGSSGSATGMSFSS